MGNIDFRKILIVDKEDYYFNPHILLFKDINCGSIMFTKFKEVVETTIEDYIEQLQKVDIDYLHDKRLITCKSVPNFKNLSMEDIILVCEDYEESMKAFTYRLAHELGCRCKTIVSKRLYKFIPDYMSSNDKLPVADIEKFNRYKEQFIEYNSTPDSRYALCCAVHRSAKYRKGIVFYSPYSATNEASEDIIKVCTTNNKINPKIDLTIYDYKNDRYMDQDSICSGVDEYAIEKALELYSNFKWDDE